MDDLTKSQKRHFRELADICYERELNLALDKLYSQFERWKNNEISTWELDEEIHKHHNGISRDLYKLYDYNDKRLLVAKAVSKGIIKMAEVREDCRTLIENMVNYYKDNAND